jgi:hypothetical protein
MSTPFEPEPHPIHGTPVGDVIYNSAWDWADATRRMCEHKAYVNGDDR